MTEQTFKIVLKGSIYKGENLEQVQQRLAELFRVDLGRIEKIFALPDTVIKTRLDHGTALKYKHAIERTGACCLILKEPSHRGLSLSRPSAAEGMSTDLPKCPKCGYQAQSSQDPLIVMHDGKGECPICGIIVAKYEEKQDTAGGPEVAGEADDVPTFSDKYVTD